MKKIFLIIATAFFLTPNLNAQSVTLEDSITTFYDSLFVVFEQQYLYRDSVDFDALKPVIMDSALSCSTFEESLYHARTFFDAVGGNHCMIFRDEFFINATPKRELTQDDFSVEFLNKYDTNPQFTVKVLDNQYGYVLVPGIMSWDLSPDTLHAITQNMYDQIMEVECKNDLKGWILDLRFNIGGLSQPMILAFYNFLGNSPTFAELGAKFELEDMHHMKKGTYISADTVYTYIDKTGKMNTKTPVVIINGIMTGSAGETLGLAFRGRENVLFVGEETYGFLTGNAMAYLPYGAQMAFSTCYMSDRSLKYTETIKPDISISKQDNFENLMLDANVIAAIKFIESKQ